MLIQKLLLKVFLLNLTIAIKNSIKLKKKQNLELSKCKFILIRQDPPFNLEYISTTYILDTIKSKVKIINAYLEAPKKGFNTQLMGKDLLYWSSILLDLSRKGLENRDILSKKGNNETVFLKHLQKVIDNKTTNADHMISKFSKNENLDELYDK